MICFNIAREGCQAIDYVAGKAFSAFLFIDFTYSTNIYWYFQVTSIMLDATEYRKMFFS